MTRFRIVELDILRGGDTAMYPVAADSPFHAVQKFYMERKPQVSDYILVIPEVYIFEHWKDGKTLRKLHWKTEMDNEKIESTIGLAELFIKEESSL